MQYIVVVLCCICVPCCVLGYVLGWLVGWFRITIITIVLSLASNTYSSVARIILYLVSVSVDWLVGWSIVYLPFDPYLLTLACTFATGCARLVPRTVRVLLGLSCLGWNGRGEGDSINIKNLRIKNYIYALYTGLRE